MFHGKKGVSPLIATLLLIFFALALGTVVMSWGENYIAERAEFVGGPEVSGCSSVDFSLITVGGVAQACYDQDAKQLSLMIENGPDADVSNFNAYIVGTEGVQTLENILKEPLKRAHALKKIITYNGVGVPGKVKLIPFLTVDHTALYCDDAALVIEDELHACST